MSRWSGVILLLVVNLRVTQSLIIGGRGARLPPLRVSLRLDQPGGVPPHLPLVTLEEWLRRAERMYGEHGAALGQIATSGPRRGPVPDPEDARPAARRAPPPSSSRRLSAGGIGRRSPRVFRQAPRRARARRPTSRARRGSGACASHVDERVLIPRSYFVEILPDAGRPVDLRIPQGSPGSPTCARARAALRSCSPATSRAARVDAIDLSPGALEVAADQREAPPAGRTRPAAVESDLLAAVPAGRYDVILSNPPYEPSAHVDALPEEFRREPRIALDGGPDGLGLVRRLVRQAAAAPQAARDPHDRGGRGARRVRARVRPPRAPLVPHRGRKRLRLPDPGRAAAAPSRPGQVVEGVAGEEVRTASGRACASRPAGGRAGRSGSTSRGRSPRSPRSRAGSRAGSRATRSCRRRFAPCGRRTGRRRRFFQKPWLTNPTVTVLPTRSASRITPAGSCSSWTVREQMIRSKWRSGKALMNSVMSPW